MIRLLRLNRLFDPVFVCDVDAAADEILLLDESGYIVIAALVAVDLDARLGHTVPAQFSISWPIVLELSFHSLILLLLLLTRIICFYKNVIET